MVWNPPPVELTPDLDRNRVSERRRGDVGSDCREGAGAPRSKRSGPWLCATSARREHRADADSTSAASGTGLRHKQAGADSISFEEGDRRKRHGVWREREGAGWDPPLASARDIGTQQPAPAEDGHRPPCAGRPAGHYRAGAGRGRMRLAGGGAGRRLHAIHLRPRRGQHFLQPRRERRGRGPAATFTIRLGGELSIDYDRERPGDDVYVLPDDGPGPLLRRRLDSAGRIRRICGRHFALLLRRRDLERARHRRRAFREVGRAAHGGLGRRHCDHGRSFKCDPRLSPPRQRRARSTLIVRDVTIDTAGAEAIIGIDGWHRGEGELTLTAQDVAIGTAGESAFGVYGLHQGDGETEHRTLWISPLQRRDSPPTASSVGIEARAN